MAIGGAESAGELQGQKDNSIIHFKIHGKHLLLI
jgi:hypothetical protein